ncbi:alpha/beta fold hydrolase [Actinopolymorpha pittospori]|uniref:Pimeloyl-ACP methyl ester carboxylesterase n=1 Tax=Actinopolymorpha pittospori TaxID=648752 RepID=A0A927N5Q6_9ACTN|nr:alpha/beta fold hydrolase [Actinopolymorpha pittospori]MBE1612594.1 pimeloyl-ACP methyl ester carboxylesterase [Actinopolymorpha pittospori]
MPDVIAEYTMPGIHVTERMISVPLDWSRPDGEQITVFVRELVDPPRRRDDLPLLVYLQGGPGGKSPRPVDRSGWLGVALERYRVVLLDQRGTGRSTPIDAVTIQRRGSALEQAEYLTMFRADSIVLDAEAVRTKIYDGRRWATLGQSFGGFITLTYLSFAPEGLAACYVTGGIPGVPPVAAEVYRRTFPRVIAKTRAYYRRYPQDVDTVAAIVDRLAAGDVALPDGDRLSVQRFQSLGGDLGMGPGAQRLHWLVTEAFAERSRLSEDFLQQVQVRTAQRGGPLFWTLQESIYGDGDNGPIGWAAESEARKHPECSPDARPLIFTGEMTYRWMFDEIAALRPFAAAVDQLAQRTNWTRLYDPDRLAANEVPLAAAVYHDDMFVDSGLQLQSLAGIGNSRAWVSNEWEHDGVGDVRVLRGLLQRIDDDGGERR